MSNMQKGLAEFVGTFWLVFGGCGSAVIAAGFPALGIGFLGVALAFGLTVVTMVYACGRISGGHLHPAVTVCLWVGGRFDALGREYCWEGGGQSVEISVVAGSSTKKT